jgi:hypothetical protein
VSPAGRRKSPLKRTGGCLVAIAALYFLIAGMEMLWTRIDERRFPWAYSRPGRSTLVGTWVGTLTTGGGVRRGMYLDIRLDPLNFSRRGRRRRGSSNIFRRPQSSKLEGNARLCGGEAEQRFTLRGNNETDDASRFYLALAVADSTPPNGFAPSHMRGRWDGRDSLALEADVYLRRGQSAISATDDPHTGKPAIVEMRRADEAEFRALCARVPRR